MAAKPGTPVLRRKPTPPGTRNICHHFCLEHLQEASAAKKALNKVVGQRNKEEGLTFSKLIFTAV